MEKYNDEKEPFLCPSDRAPETETEPEPEPELESVSELEAESKSELDLERNEKDTRREKRNRKWAVWIRIALASYLLGVFTTALTVCANGGAIPGTGMNRGYQHRQHHQQQIPQLEHEIMDPELDLDAVFPGVWVECGGSVTDARERGCRFSMEFQAWIPGDQVPPGDDVEELFSQRLDLN